MTEIIYAESETPSSNLPMYVMLDFCDTYTSGSSFSNKSSKHELILINPTTTTWYTYNSNIYKEHSCIQILLKISCGWTVLKSQEGMFTEKYCINLSTSEADHRLTYVVLSRAKKISQIEIILAIT